jgi:peptidoglycan/LPS O-acetylase OafA/YrhL
MTWRPNWKQWAVIFGTAIIALFLWGGAAGYGSVRERQQQERVAVSVVVIGVLLVWFLSEKRA